MESLYSDIALVAFDDNNSKSNGDFSPDIFGSPEEFLTANARGVLPWRNHQIDFQFSSQSADQQALPKPICPTSPEFVVIPTQITNGVTNLLDCTRYGNDSKTVDSFNKVKDSVVKITGTRKTGDRVSSPTGSGFFITPDGMLATDLHLVKGLKDITVTADDGKRYKAYVVAVDRRYDIAILKVEDADDMVFKALTLGSSQTLKKGDNVTGWGYPADSTRMYVSPGSAPSEGFRDRSPLKLALEQRIGRKLSDNEIKKHIPTGERANRDVLDIDILVNLGNSGGPLTDRDNQAVGIIGLSDTKSLTLGTPVEYITNLLAYTRREIGNTNYSVYFDEEDIAVKDTPELARERAILRANRLELDINLNSLKNGANYTFPFSPGGVPRLTNWKRP